jgi:hypothetical protein
MAITFPRVRSVAPGDEIQAADLVSLANGINARIRSGLGDWAWRLPYYWFQGARQIRNPDASGFLWPSQAEFFEFYQSVPPEAEYTWPLTGPGEPEGTNVASLLGSYVFGVTDDIAPEDERLTEEAVGGLPTGRPANAIQAWTLGKQQRGTVDPVTGMGYTPALNAARSFYGLTQGPYSPHGNSYGGFMPQPMSLGDCGDGTGTLVASANVEIFFTPLKEGFSMVTFPGTCPDENGHVLVVHTYPDYYRIVRVNAPDVILSTSDYIEGPYKGGGRLRRTWGRHIERTLNAFAVEFRGTAEQQAAEEAGEAGWTESAFDNARFFESQYLLAPARGNQSGDTIEAVYPRFQKSNVTTLRAGTPLGKPHAITTGFVGAAALIYCAYLAAPVTIEILEDAVVHTTVSLEPSGSTGIGSQIVVLDPPIRGTLSVKLASDARFTQSTGSGVAVEAAELLEYKPKHHDWAMVLRVVGGKLDLDGNLDGSGLYESAARSLSDSYFANASLVSPDNRGLPGSFVEINSNAVADAFRRFSKMVRIQNRHVIRAYAVEDGKSVLWLSRTPLGASGRGVRDWLDGIAPAAAAVSNGSVRAGVVYRVTSGTIWYQTKWVTAGEEFTGVWDGPEWEGEGTVKEAEGIYPAAPPGGYSNEWVMLFQWKNTHPGSTSLFRAEVYGDHFPFAERAHILPPVLPQPPIQLQRHFVPGQSLYLGSADSKVWIAPEAPPGYRYVIGTNRRECTSGDVPCEEERSDFYSSCPIYEAPYEVESTSLETVGGEEVVKVVFATRFRSHPDAPATVESDPSSWDLAALDAESYRTDDNAIRQYIAWSQRAHLPTLKTGDCAIDGWASSESLVGAIIPHMLWTKLIPKPYEPGPEDSEEMETVLSVEPLLHAEVAIRVGCEGWVDGKTSAAYGCETGIDSLYDWTFENLCFQAFGGRQIGIMPSEETDRNLPSEVRTDLLTGYGPVPTIPTSAEVFNQLGACVNLLDSVRIVVPFTFQRRPLSGTADRTVTDVTFGDGTAAPCSTTAGSSSGTGVVWKGVPVNPTVLTAGTWEDTSAAGSGVSAAFRADTTTTPSVWNCDGLNWVIQTTRSDDEYRWGYLSEDVLNAMSTAWSDMIAAGAAKMLAIVTESTSHTGFSQVASSSDGMTCRSATGRWITGAEYLAQGEYSTVNTTSCSLVASTGVISARPLGIQGVAGAYWSGTDPGVCSLSSASNTLSYEAVDTDAIALVVPIVG